MSDDFRSCRPTRVWPPLQSAEAPGVNPSQLRVSTPDGSQAFSSTTPAPLGCSASWAFFFVSDRVCSDRHPSRSGPALPDIRVTSGHFPDKLDVTPLAVAGSRPATDQSVQGTSPRLMLPVSVFAGPRRMLKSAHEKLGPRAIRP
jgi:hypothetical protein